MLFNISYKGAARDARIFKLPSDSTKPNQAENGDLRIALLRTALEKRGLMSPQDCFFVSGAALDAQSEEDLSVDEIFPAPKDQGMRQLTIRIGATKSGQTDAKTLNLKISYEGNARASVSLTLDRERIYPESKDGKRTPLSVLRSELQTRSLMSEADNFIVAGARFDKASEEQRDLDSACPASQEGIHAVVVQLDTTGKPEEETDFTVKRSWDDRSFALRKKPSETLSAVRASLTWMEKSDLFQTAQGASVAAEDEASRTLGDLGSKDGLLTIFRKKTSFNGNPDKAKLPDKQDLKPTDPGYKIQPDSSDDTWGSLVQDMDKALAGVQVETFDDFKTLPPEQQRALVAKLDLLKGIRFSISESSVSVARSPLTPIRYSPRQGVPLARQPSISKTGFKSASIHRTIHELRQNSIYATSATASIGMDGLGDLALDISYRNEKEKYERSEKSTAWVLCSVIANKIVIDFDPSTEFKPHPELLTSIDAVLAMGQSVSAYQALHERVFQRFGYFLATEVALGGKFQKSSTVTFTKSSKIETELQSFNVGLAATADLQAYGRYGGGAGVSGSESKSDSNVVEESLTKTTYLITGGDDSTAPTFEDDTKWSASLKAVNRWAVIDILALTPLLTLLPERQKRGCASLITNFSHSSIDRHYTPIDMRSLVGKSQADLLDSLL